MWQSVENGSPYNGNVHRIPVFGCIPFIWRSSGGWSGQRTRPKPRPRPGKWVVVKYFLNFRVVLISLVACLGRNEVFVRCGTACPRTCSNRGTSSDRNCVQVCVPGCFCQRGYVRDRLWQCVRSRQCRRQESGTRSGLGPVVDDVAADGVTEVDAAVGAQPDVKNPAL